MPQRFRDLFPLPQRIAYLGWYLLGKRWPITLSLKTGQKLSMRRDSAYANDHDTAYEVFISDFYRPDQSVPCDQALNIVDLGANVGYATMYHAHHLPKAHIYCFEPHPVSFGVLVDNLRRNHLMYRVTLYKAAASNVTRPQFLTDDAVCSTVVASAGDRRFRVTQLDLLRLSSRYENRHFQDGYRGRRVRHTGRRPFSPALSLQYPDGVAFRPGTRRR